MLAVLGMLLLCLLPFNLGKSAPVRVGLLVVGLVDEFQAFEPSASTLAFAVSAVFVGAVPAAGILFGMAVVPAPGFLFWASLLVGLLFIERMVISKLEPEGVHED